MKLTRLLHTTSSCLRFLTLAVGTALLIAACHTTNKHTLMPTPVIYEGRALNPFDHIHETQRSTRNKVFFATNRQPVSNGSDIRYGNDVSSYVHFGEAAIRMGAPHAQWQDIVNSSMDSLRETPIPLTLESFKESTRIPIGTSLPLSEAQRQFAKSINRELATANDKEIMVYVHGTKVDFANSAILASEIDHFAGRDFVSVAFSWPSHQSIFYYLSRIDVERARRSSVALEEVLEFLAEHTTAKRINVIAYSAGGKVLSKALAEMRAAHANLNTSTFRSKLKLGSIVFAAADVEIDLFLQRLPSISECAEEVAITVTDDDNALKAAKRFMGGKARIGEISAEKTEMDFIKSHHLRNVEIIDVSHGREARGFDIAGHHYWYRHPWMSSDIVLLMRTDMPPHLRGLSRSKKNGIWYLPLDYPAKARAAAARKLKSEW